MAWEYKRQEQQFELLPVGPVRLRVQSAEKATSKNGNDMITLKFDVSGSKKTLYYYIVFMADRPEVTNRMLTSFFDSFAGIPEGELNLNKWVGAVGAAQIKHEEYNGNMQEKIHYFIKHDKQDDLPPWKEPDGTAVDKDGFMEVPELPDISFN